MIAAALRRIFPHPCATAARTHGEDLAPLLPAEQAAVHGAVPGRRQEFAAGRAAARAALQEIGFPGAAIPAGPDRAPQWPVATVGSIAHSHGCAVAVVARAREVAAVGVDLERTAAVREELWSQILGRREQDWIESQARAERARFVTAMFCAKEAFYKFQYPLSHAWVEFDAVQVTLDPAAETFQLSCRVPVTINSTSLSNLEGRFVVGAAFTAAGLYSIV